MSLVKICQKSSETANKISSNAKEAWKDASINKKKRKIIQLMRMSKSMRVTSLITCEKVQDEESNVYIEKKIR